MKVAVELDFGERFGNTRFGYGFKLVRHGTSCFREARLVSRDPCSVIQSPGLLNISQDRVSASAESRSAKSTG
jgi:hypothetical protein